VSSGKERGDIPTRLRRLIFTEDTLKKIIQGVQHFQTNVFPKHRERFADLAKSQSPEALFICCSDSRISLDLVTQSGPGDLFVCRNAGNIVPVYGQGDAVSGTIEYAVSVLNINHIVVCGHSDCGAMKALLRPESLTNLSAVREWLRHAEAARCAFDTQFSHPEHPTALRTLTMLNIRLQLAHLATHPKVFARTREGSLHLHGWLYQIDTGEVQSWDSLTEEWLPFEKSALVSQLESKADAFAAQ
jgi:carbonic anhydrase